MKFIDKLTNMLMSRNEEDYDEEEFEEEEELEEVEETRQVVNGPAVTYNSNRASAAPINFSRPKLTVHETKVRELTVQIYVPVRFDQVAKIADALLANRAAIVNYEKVEQLEQRRICDFLNGVCYILDGEPHRISEQMVIYVPTGVEISEAKALYK